jgi:O-antigen/teichoic acid export membrane protein
MKVASGYKRIRSVSILKRNIVANFLGKGWTILINLLFIPLYIKFIGIEAYGLIGVYFIVTVIISQLDGGLNVSLNRELARLSVNFEKRQESRNLVRTLEVIYWILAGVIALIFMAISPFIVNHWLNPEALSHETVKQAFLIMSLAATLQLPFIFYSGGLRGLQKQVQLNTIIIIAATFRGLGSVLILWLISPTIQAFLLWQIVVNIIMTYMGAKSLWNNLPKTEDAACFKMSLLLGMWKFTVGMGAISITVVVLTQLDKIILSKMLSLEMFGYYILASTVAVGLYNLIGPLFNAFFPRFSQLVLRGDKLRLKQLYHQSSQLVSVVVLSIAIVVALFSEQILLVWTGDPDVVYNTHLLLSVLIVGTALNCLMSMPYTVQLAHGWTKLALYQNIISIILLIPLLLWTTSKYGALGAAFVWVILNAGYVLFGVQIMHRRLIKGEQWKWYVNDIGRPLIGVLVVTVTASVLIAETNNKIQIIVWLGGILFFSVISAAFMAPLIRKRIIHLLKI